MERPLLVLKPNLLNSIVPTFSKNLFYSSMIMLILYGLLTLLEKLNIFELGVNKIFWGIILILLFSTLLFLIKVVILHYTTYSFFRIHVTREFKLFSVKKHSVPYTQITNISIDISIWDRMCKAGDITLNTAEDIAPNLILHYVKDPEKIENGIYKIISNNKQINQRN